MKIQILENIKDSIDGFNPFLLQDGNINIDIPDNSATMVLLTNTIESIEYSHLDGMLGLLKKITRKGGNVIIGGIDVNCLSRDLINGFIDVETYNKLVFSKKSLYDSKGLANRLSEIGFTIDKILLRGSVYELHASRSN